jgi:hypothetical protein
MIFSQNQKKKSNAFEKLAHREKKIILPKTQNCGFLKKNTVGISKCDRKISMFKM